jgi:hypothetical protein
MDSKKARYFQQSMRIGRGEAVKFSAQRNTGGCGLNATKIAVKTQSLFPAAHCPFRVKG